MFSVGTHYTTAHEDLFPTPTPPFNSILLGCNNTGAASKSWWFLESMHLILVSNSDWFLCTESSVHTDLWGHLREKIKSKLITLWKLTFQFFCWNNVTVAMFNLVQTTSWNVIESVQINSIMLNNLTSYFKSREIFSIKASHTFFLCDVKVCTGLE